MIKFGACVDVDLEKIKQSAQGDCDYVELNFGSLTQLGDDEYQELKKTLKQEGIKAFTANCFIPGNFQITGPDANLTPIKVFVEGGMKRANEIGIKIIVFGSGGARNLPDGFTDKEMAFDQCKEFLREISPIAKKYSVKIAIEPLRYEESNIINTVAQGKALAKAADCDNVGVLADLYHMLCNGENIEDIIDVGDLLWHCHIARKLDRQIPQKNDGEDYAIFFDTLKKINYEGMISTEGKADNFDVQVKESMEVLKSFI